MTTSKLMNMAEAISRWVADGSSVAMGTTLETAIPFAAGHEIMRQGKKHLTLVGPISDILFDQIIGAGCVQRVRAAWVGNVITGVGYNFRRAVKQLPDRCRGSFESDHFDGPSGRGHGRVFPADSNCPWQRSVCEQSGIEDRYMSVYRSDSRRGRGYVPDVAIVHVQRSDAFGNVHVWGNMGITREACMASRHVIVTAEEIVSTEMITRDPNRILTPGFKVRAVVHAPWGAHPSPMPGCYNRDHAAFLDYQGKPDSGLFCVVDGSVDMLHFIDSSICRSFGIHALSCLSITHHDYSEPVDYGY